MSTSDQATSAASHLNRKEIAFIDTGVANYLTLVDGVQAGVEVVLVDASQDGLAQIALWAQTHSGYDAIHILSHGSSGSLYLGNFSLTDASITQRSAELTAIGRSLNDQGDILLYGCNVANGAVGADFIAKLVQATGADVAASDDPTGSAAFGGDWVLEAQRGAITTETAFAASALGSYVGLLSVSDQNLDSESQFISPNAITSRNAGTWTFSAANAVDMAVGDINDFPGLYLVGTGDKAFIWNSGHNTGLISNVTQFSFTASDGTDFDLNSLSLSGASYSDFGTYAQTMSVTISGWRDSVQVVSGETVDLRTSDSSGNITYTMGGTGSLDDGLGTVYFHGYGQLSFGSAFDSVDEIRLSFGGAVTAEIDNIDISPTMAGPTVSVAVADTALSVGETSAVTFSFSEAVTGFSNADLTIPNGTLSNVSSSNGGSTWTATFTPTNGVTDSSNVISVDMTGVTSVATSNAGTGTTDSNNFSIDTQRPTATISLNDTALRVGETATATFTFSEAVTGFTNADLTIANGTLSPVSSSDGGTIWTATFTPSNVTAATNVITLDNTGVTDAAGNVGSGTTDSGNYAIDRVQPTLASSITISDTALRMGDTATVTFTFTEAVSGFTIADLTAPNASLSSLSSSDGGITWTATLTPTGSTTAASNVITLDYTGITDLAGNAGSSTATSGNYAVDTTGPTVSNVTASTSNGIYKASDTVTVQVNFSENVTVTGTPQLTLETGTTDRVVNYASGSGSSTLVFTYTVQAGDTSADLDYLSTTALALNSGTIQDAAGNNATLTLASPGAANSLGANKAIVIDTTAPTISAIALSGSPAASATSISYAVTFAESVTGVDTSDFTLTTTGTSAGTITGVTGSGSSYTVSVGSISGSGTLRLDLNSSGTGITDTTGNAISGGYTSGATHTASINSAPSISNLSGDSVAWDWALGSTVVLDSGSNASLSDAELGALNSGNGDWSGASLTVNRVSSGSADAVSGDVFSFNTSSALFTVNGSNLQSSGQTFATYTRSGGVLTINFTSTDTNATTALVNDVAQHINYLNSTPYGDASVRFALNDGTSSTTADVTVTSSRIYVDQTSDDSDNDAADGFSLREALVRSAAQSGADTVYLGNIASGTTLTLNSSTTTLGAGDTLNYTPGSAANLTIAGASGGGLALAGAATAASPRKLCE